jgi:hypothetical protein
MSTNWTQHLAIEQTSTGMVLAGVANVAEGTLALDSAYTYGSAGDAIMAMAFIAPESANLTDIWFKVSSYSGTWGSTDGNINWSIREGMNGNRIPGTTLTGSGTFALDGSTTGWWHMSGLSVALTAGKQYLLILADADGGATNYVTLVSRYGTSPSAAVPYPISSEVGVSTNGFSTAYTQTGASPALAVNVGGKYLCGLIFNTMSTVASGTYERGIRFSPPDDCTFIGWRIALDNTVMIDGHGLKLYADGVNPGGSTLASISAGATPLGGATVPAVNNVIIPSTSWVDLTGGSWYRATVDPSSNLTTPRKLTSGGSPDSELFAASVPMKGNFHWTEESGGAWSDDTSAMATFGPILVPKTAVAGGGSVLMGQTCL